ncbi:hypothetical protein U1Q18_011643 [Sarracenia purpurea var. burkii]
MVPWYDGAGAGRRSKDSDGGWTVVIRVALMMVGAVGEDARDERPMMAGRPSGLKEMKGDKNPLVYSLSQTKNNPGKATLYPLYREWIVNGDVGSGHEEDEIALNWDWRINVREGARDRGKRGASNYQPPKPNLAFTQAVISGKGEDDSVRARREAHEKGISKIVSSGFIDGVRQKKRAWMQSNPGTAMGQDTENKGQEDLIVEAKEVNEAWLKSCVIGIVYESIKVFFGVVLGGVWPQVGWVLWGAVVGVWVLWVVGFVVVFGFVSLGGLGVGLLQGCWLLLGGGWCLVARCSERLLV